MKALYTATMTARNGRDGEVADPDQKLKLKLVMPKELGGRGGEGTNPEQLFAAGYAACFDSALRFVAGQKKIPVKESTVTAQVSIGKAETVGFRLAVKLDVYLPGLSEADAGSLVEAAHQVCPYSNATRNNVQVDLGVRV